MFQRMVGPVIFLSAVLLITYSSISKNDDGKESHQNAMDYFKNRSSMQRDRIEKYISRVTTLPTSETAQSPRIGRRQSIDDSSVADENKYDLYSTTENIFTEEMPDSYDSLLDTSQQNKQTSSSSLAQRQLVNITIPHPQYNSYFQKSIMENEIIREERSFYAMGDTPYDDYEAYLLGKQLREINSATTVSSDDNAATFIVHLGDVKKTTDCKFSEYASVRQILLQSRLKMFIIPGDNDFNDCPDPNTAWEHWMTNFKKFDLNWRPPITGFRVTRQRRRIENFSFSFHGVLFIGVNLLGGLVHNKTEWKERHRDNFMWTRRNLRRYTKPDSDGNKIDAVVLLGHSKRRGNNDDYFDRLFDLIEYKYSDVPFLYLHGDGHRYDERIKYDNFFDLQVDQGRKAPPLKVTISHEKTRLARDKFSLDRRGGRY